MDDTMGLGLGPSTAGCTSRMTRGSGNRGGGYFGTAAGRGRAPKEARYDFASLAEGFERRIDTIKSYTRTMSKFYWQAATFNERFRKNYQCPLDTLLHSGSLLRSSGGKDRNVRLCVTLESKVALTA